MILHVVAICLFVSGFSLADDTLDRLARVETLLADVLGRNGELEKRMAALEQENDAMKQTNQILEQRIAQVEEERDTKEAGIKNVVELAGTDHENGERSSRFVSDIEGTVVAFTAVVAPPQLTNLGSGQAVIYDTTVTNIGGAYHNKTGIFTAPASGAYVFNYAVMMDPGFSEYIELVKNGDHVMWNYGHAPGASHYISASRTSTVELTVGDRVWVRTQVSTTHGDGIIHGNGFTTFSGWLITLF